jgi:hypothetical protein
MCIQGTSLVGALGALQGTTNTDALAWTRRPGTLDRLESVINADALLSITSHWCLLLLSPSYILSSSSTPNSLPLKSAYFIWKCIVD